MRAQLYYIAFKTIVVKEVSRFARIWIQTILPPAITMALMYSPLLDGMKMHQKQFHSSEFLIEPCVRGRA